MARPRPILGRHGACGADGVCVGADRSTRITHTDPRAFDGAFLLATWARLAVSLGRQPSLEELEGAVGSQWRDPDTWLPLLASLKESLGKGESSAAFVTGQGWTKGPTGFVVHTVGAALHVLHSPHDSWEATVRSTVRLGGDTDSVAAVVSALASLAPGREGVPKSWENGLGDWPMTARWLREVEGQARQAWLDQAPVACRSVWVGSMWARNITMAALMLGHVVRRAMPPY